MLKFMLQHLNLCLELLLDVIRHASEGSTFQNLKIIPPRRTWPCAARSRARRPLFPSLTRISHALSRPVFEPAGLFSLAQDESPGNSDASSSSPEGTFPSDYTSANTR